MKRAAYAGSYLAALAILLTTGWWTASKVSFDWTVHHWPLFGLSLLFLMLAVLVSARVWRRVVVTFGIEIPISSALLHVCLSLTGKYLPGKIWGLAVRHRALLGLGSTNRNAVAALALEQTSLLVTAGLLSVPALLGLAKWIHEAATFALVLMLLGLAVLTIVWMTPRCRRVLIGLPSVRLLFPVALLSVVQWALSGIALVLVAVGLGVTLDSDTALVLFSALPASVVAGMLAVFAPGGLGVREATLVALCGPAIGFPAALAAALTLRIIASVRDLICALAIPILLRRRDRSAVLSPGSD